MTLKELHEALEENGVEISYSGLSEFVNSGDIAELLNVTGKGNRKEFHAKTVYVLAAFMPKYRAANGKLPQAASMLRAFLKPSSDEHGNMLPELLDFRHDAATGTALALTGPNTGDVVTLLQRLVTATEGRAVPIDDALLSLKAAAATYGVSMKVLRELSITEGGRRKVRKTAVLNYIAGL